jgi:hypothetical protein
MDDPQPVERLRPDVPSEIAALVRKMMAKKPEDRYQTPAEVAAALSLVLDMDYGIAVPEGEPGIEGGVVRESRTDSGGDTLTSTWADLTQASALTETSPLSLRRPAVNRRWLQIGVAGGSLAVLGIGVLLAVLLQEPDSQQQPGAKKSKGTGMSKQVGAKTPPEVFQDFESGSYGDWKATGTAFGDRPATGAWPGQQPVTGFGGKYLVNTFVHGDGGTGTLTSPEFTIRRPYIQFRIGGGNLPGQTCINLVVERKVVRTATGKNKEHLEWDFWDVRELTGHLALLQIVDQATVAWGHINVDDIRFADEARTSETK